MILALVEAERNIKLAMGQIVSLGNSTIPFSESFNMKLLSIFFTFCFSTAFAQVEVEKDLRVDLLFKNQEELNKKAWLENNRSGPGFRIVVINTNDRQVALDVKSRLMRDFPDHKTYLLYQAPNFRIQFGNFRIRKEADAMKIQLAKIFTNNLIIIPTTVEYKPEEEPVQ